MKIISVNNPENFVCHIQVIMTNMDQGRKVGVDISRIYTDYDSNIIGPHMNTILTDEGRNKDSNTGLDKYSKPDIDTTKWSKFLLNDPLNLNINPPNCIFVQKYYGTPITLPKDRKESQPSIISHKKVNITE